MNKIGGAKNFHEGFVVHDGVKIIGGVSEQTVKRDKFFAQSQSAKFVEAGKHFVAVVEDDIISRAIE